MASRKRGGAISGLLSVPQPLPDDEDEPQPPDELPATQTAPQQSPVVRSQEPTAPTAEVPGAASPSASPKGPPGTIRLNETAGRLLWEAFVEAKTEDPFLSYRQFASQVVRDGLAVRERRQRRSS